MAIFNGKYSWDGTKTKNYRPIAWFPGTYNLTIIDRSKAGQKVQQLKPYICIFSETGDGQSIYAHPEKFAQQVCNDFSLNIERVLWVEEFYSGEKRFDILLFHKTGKLGETIFYRAERRRAVEKEISMIRNELEVLENR